MDTIKKQTLIHNIKATCSFAKNRNTGAAKKTRSPSSDSFWPEFTGSIPVFLTQRARRPIEILQKLTLGTGMVENHIVGTFMVETKDTLPLQQKRHSRLDRESPTKGEEKKCKNCYNPLSAKNLEIPHQVRTREL